MSSYWAGRPRYLDEVDEWWVVYHEEQLAGWLGFSVHTVLDRPVLFFDTLVTMPRYQRTALGSMLTMEAWLSAAVRTLTLPIMAMRTQNPVVLHMVRRHIPETYPRVAQQSPGHKASQALTAAQAMAARRPGRGSVDTRSFVVRGIWPGAIVAPDVTCRDNAVNAFFATEIRIEDGDGVWVIAVLTTREALRLSAAYPILRLVLRRTVRR